jgi:hypothetical protein
MSGASEILCLGFVARRDQVPAGAALADQIERCKLACKREGLFVGRARRANEPDVPSEARERGHKGERLDPGDVMHAMQPVRMSGQRALRVGREQHIEAPALRRLRHFNKALEIDPRIHVRIGVTP